MIDRYLIDWQKRLLTPTATWCHARGWRANQVTFAALVPALAAGICIIAHLPMTGLAFIALNRVLDGLDGTLARVEGPTDRGAFFDIAFDFFFYALMPLAFVLNDPARNAVAGALLLASFVVSGTSFLAFAVIAARRGLQSSAFPNKGFYYLGGLTEGAETILAFTLMCLFPNAFVGISLVFACLVLLTILMRWRFAWEIFAP
ncbi:MAG: CDP-alcohol phosphatidyltransferase family protein [Hyphomicrobiales bacterium]|nr:CDP-alcohol phosphatidyltransferase family protein [Hyphomicrobiales bacterium]MDE2114114.1 CDP-alcohol phosphatidyltransferase family protein [Hyphomicrobiales bacterium]